MSVLFVVVCRPSIIYVCVRARARARVVSPGSVLLESLVDCTFHSHQVLSLMPKSKVDGGDP